MDSNELFAALKEDRSAFGRERLISQAISEGNDIEEVRAMLDYLDEYSKQASPKPNFVARCLTSLRLQTKL